VLLWIALKIVTYPTPGTRRPVIILLTSVFEAWCYLCTIPSLISIDPVLVTLLSAMAGDPETLPARLRNTLLGAYKAPGGSAPDQY